MLWCSASQPSQGNCGPTSCMKKSLFSSQRHPRLMWCDKDKHNAAVSLSLIVYCFSLLRISSLAGIRLRSRHLRPIKNKHGVWFDLLDDFQYSCCFFVFFSGGLQEGWRWKGWQFEPSLSAALVFHVSGSRTNKPDVAAPVVLTHSVWGLFFLHLISRTNEADAACFQVLETNSRAY